MREYCRRPDGKIIYVRLTPDLNRRLKQEAERTNTACTVVIRLLLKTYLPQARVRLEKD